MALKQEQTFVIPSAAGGLICIDDFESAARPPAIDFSEGRYAVRCARTEEEIDGALRLRFEVFNLELNEGLEASFINERDEDQYDRLCHHLLVVEKETGAVVGTYRLLTLELAGSAYGFYSANEFTLETLPCEVLAASLEIGRACIAREHRNTKVLFLLWKGLARYLAAARKRYLFGCCSLSSRDFTQGKRALRRLARGGCFHPALRVRPREEFMAGSEDCLTADTGDEIELPKLFDIYLRFGAKVCGEPVIDRSFGTIDFFVIFDIRAMNEKYFGMFFT